VPGRRPSAAQVYGFFVQLCALHMMVSQWSIGDADGKLAKKKMNGGSSGLARTGKSAVAIT
jgi:hypothetical protein